MSQAEPSTPVQAITAPEPQLVAAVPPWALVVIAIVSVQIGAGLAKQLFPTVGPSGVVFIRTALGSLIFALARPRFTGYTRQQYLSLAVYGVVIAAMMLTFYAAIDRNIPLGIIVAIAFMGPLGVALAGSRRAQDLIWVALAAVGILLLSPITNVNLDPLGIFLAVLSSVTWAIYIVMTPRVGKVFSGNSGLAMSMFVASIVAAPFGLAGAIKILADPTLIIIGILVALLSSAIPFALEFRALKRLPTRVFGMLASLEPVIASIIGFVMLHENLQVTAIIGIILVTVAAVATARSASQT